jgi:hypothetical protein
MEPRLSPNPSQQRGVDLLGPFLLGAALALFLFEAREVRPHYDDAYISYRYAANLVEGNGLVFNPGEYVEGFSNPLWTLLIALGLALGAGAKVTGHALGVVAGSATLIATYAWARSGLARSQSGWAGIAAWIVLASPVFARWSLSGMETPLFVGTTTAALAACAWKRPGWAAAFAGLAALTRPEGPLVAAAIFGLALAGPARRRRSTWMALAGYVSLLAGFLTLRLLYYGDFVPNTFYAKVGDVSHPVSALFTGVFLLENAGILVLPAALAVAHDRRAWPGAAFAAAIAIYGYAVGSVWRYLLPLVPCLAVLGVHGVISLWRRGVAPRAAATALLVSAFALSFLGLSGFRGPGDGLLDRAARVGGIEREREEDAKGEALGRRRTQVILERGERTHLVATGAIGSFGFYSRLPILDILGLVDPTIARSRPRGAEAGYAIPGHQRSDPDYVLSREPDYILIGKEVDASLRTLVPAPEALRTHPDLQLHYAWDAEVVGFRRLRAPVER